MVRVWNGMSKEGFWSFSALQTPLNQKHLDTRKIPNIKHLPHVARTYVEEWGPLGVKTVFFKAISRIVTSLENLPVWTCFSGEPWRLLLLHLYCLAAFTCWLIFLLCQNKGNIHWHISTLKNFGCGFELTFFWKVHCSLKGKHEPNHSL